MTANQIAAASVKETERHNEVYESETERHNQVMEDVQKEANRITEEHNQATERLTREYNEAYLDYLNAAEEDKVFLENRMNDIKEEIKNNDGWYNWQMADINRKAQESKSNYENAIANIQEQNLELQKKRDYYENQKTEAQTMDIYNSIDFKKRQLWLEKQRIDKEYSARVIELDNAYHLGMINAETKSAELHLAKEQFDENVKRWESVYKTQETEKTEYLKQQQKTERSKRAEGVSKAVKNYADIPIGLIDILLPF